MYGMIEMICLCVACSVVELEDASSKVLDKNKKESTKSAESFITASRLIIP